MRAPAARAPRRRGLRLTTRTRCGSERFIIYDLDDTHLMVQPHVVDELQVCARQLGLGPQCEQDEHLFYVQPL